MANSTTTAVVHLLWSGAELASFERFLNSLDKHDPGTLWEPVIIFKGIEPGSAVEADRLKLLKGRTYRRIDLADEQMDLGDYRLAAEQLPHDRLCFLNSHSEILVDNWLKSLTKALDKQPEAGVVSATGSHEMAGPETPFPNVHIRTNAFLIDRELFLSLQTGDLSTKAGCGAFEAGPQSLTQQIIARGLIPYVVDRDGKAHAPEDWREAKTFRSGDQEMLMVADNRTRHWDGADKIERGYLETLAWTDRDPGPNPAKRGRASFLIKSIIHRLKGDRARF